jgi:hypothetical protein
MRFNHPLQARRSERKQGVCLMMRIACSATLFIALIHPLRVDAQPSGSGARAPAVHATPSNRRSCGQPTDARQAQRRQQGQVAGAAAGVLGGLLGVGVPVTVGVSVSLTSFLTDALIDLLECKEQLQAVGATLQATERAERTGAPTKIVWQSQVRPGVTGSSTAALEPKSASDGGSRCMTVTDVVIIDGEETVLPKRMCRTPPSTRYARV